MARAAHRGAGAKPAGVLRGLRAFPPQRGGVALMVRRLFGVLVVAVVLCLGAVLADEITGTITKVDTAKKTVTVKGEDGKEATYECAFDVQVTRGFGGKGGGGGGKRGEPPPPGTLETLQETLEGK